MDFADEFRQPNQSIIDPALFTKVLHITLQELAALAKVHHAIVSAMPGNSKSQTYLREALGLSRPLLK
jgi:hypothetical protein